MPRWITPHTLSPESLWGGKGGRGVALLPGWCLQVGCWAGQDGGSSGSTAAGLRWAPPPALLRCARGPTSRFSPFAQVLEIWKAGHLDNEALNQVPG